MFLTKWVEKCLRLSDFAKMTWIIEGSEAFFSRPMRANTCSLVGGLIGFDFRCFFREVLLRAEDFRPKAA